MTANRQKRSSDQGITDGLDQAERVGGRHRPGPLPAGGGGYLDICTTERLAVEDPRLGELRDMGLPAHWVRVAEQIGVDSFLLTWQLLSEAESVQDDYGRVHIPNFTSWLRHQRNRWIVTMARQGSTAQEIRQVLIDRLGYDLSLGHIRELMKS